MVSDNFIPYEGVSYSPEETQERSQAYYEYMDKRRTVREFSDKPSYHDAEIGRAS